MRNDREENKRLGKRIAQKLNGTIGSDATIIPMKGVFSADRWGAEAVTKMDRIVSGEWYGEEADSAPVESTKVHLGRTKVEMMDVNAHINDPQFAHMAVTLLYDRIEFKKSEDVGDRLYNLAARRI
jgi:uncharacterized protein (UPF0261 family)